MISRERALTAIALSEHDRVSVDFGANPATLRRLSADMGMQRGLLCSPEMFREFIQPRLRKLVDMAHSRRIVRNPLEIITPGGYILVPCHILQTDVPTANILAMPEAEFPFTR